MIFLSILATEPVFGDISGDDIPKPCVNPALSMLQCAYRLLVFYSIDLDTLK